MTARKWTNRRLRNLLQRYAKTFKKRWLPDGDPNVHDGMPPGSVIDPMKGCEVILIHITRGGKGVQLMVADFDVGVCVRVRPDDVVKAIRERKGWYSRRAWYA